MDEQPTQQTCNKDNDIKTPTCERHDSSPVDHTLITFVLVSLTHRSNEVCVVHPRFGIPHGEFNPCSASNSTSTTTAATTTITTITITTTTINTTTAATTTTTTTTTPTTHIGPVRGRLIGAESKRVYA
jgi:hypothetical protein